MSSITKVMPQYAMFRKGSNATCRQGVSDTFSREENNVLVDGRHVRRMKACIQKHERSSRRKSEAECTDAQTVNPEHQSGVSSVVI